MKVSLPYTLDLYFKQAMCLAMLFIYGACNSEKAIPSDIISQDIMSQIIADIKIIDAAYQSGIAPKKYLRLHRDTTKSSKLPASNDSIRTSSNILNDIETNVNIIDAENDTISDIHDTVQVNTIDSTSEFIELEQIAYSPDITRQSTYKGHIGADYEFVFKKYGVSKEQFDKSLDYYSQHPAIFFLITEKSLDILSEYLIRVKPNTTEKDTISKVVK